VRGNFNEHQRWIVFIIVYGIFLAVAVFALLAVAGLGKFIPAFQNYAVTVLIVDICGAALMGFSQIFLSQKNKLRININLAGITGATSIQIDECTYQIIGEDHKIMQTSKAFPVLGAGGWYCELLIDSPEAEFAKLTLIDNTKNTWIVRTFPIRDINVTAQK
jgi:hypothetical protein